MTKDLARELMVDFADSTGVSRKTTPRRYLWTDAFAVCNFLGLHREYGDDCYLEFALRLIDQVHHILGRHRDDDPRSGWISGLPTQEGELHPTRGGVRIGKKVNERGPDQPLDADLEWDRDGQYFHYLTKWMHALHLAAQETGENRYQKWAVELAVAAHDAFTYEDSPDTAKRMVWKMSIDLSRALVPSMGHHDPLDGLITYLELQAGEQVDAGSETDLTHAIADTSEMCEEARWATDDSLGIGSLLSDATRLAQLVFERGVERHRLLHRLLLEAKLSLQSFSSSNMLSYPAEHRLAFRELGLSIGVQGLLRISDLAKRDRKFAPVVEDLLVYRPLADQIQAFWSNPVCRESGMWKEHHDINTVMLATSLAPQGFLRL